jgi:hypothetical protein
MMGLPAVVQPLTGELVDLESADLGQLAGLLLASVETHSRLGEFESAVNEAVLTKLDRSAQWTMRLDVDGQRVEIKAPSPTAGTTLYPEDMLETELEGLVQQGTITPEAAAKALHRRIVLELGVPWDADPREIARKVKEALSIEVTGVQVRVERSEARITPVASSINALRKVPGTIDALDRAQREQPVAKRRATVKLTSEPKPRVRRYGENTNER